MKILTTALAFLFIFTGCKKKNDTPAETSTLNDGLVAHYTFNGNANDATSNNNHGVVSGATLATDRFGNSNQSYLFDGNGDFININNSTSLDLKESFSISAWINPSNYYLPGIIVWNGDAAFAKDPFILYFSDRPGYSSIGLRKDAGAGTTINEVFAPSYVLFSGVWTHIAGTANATTKQMKLYINGELVKTTGFTDMGIGYSTAGFRTMLGAAESSAGIDTYFSGKMDEVRIYNRELTASEVNQIFKQ